MAIPSNRFAKLTAREWCVMRMLADGIVPMQIADNLSISVKTVSQHVNNIEKKLGVENRLYLQKMLIKIKKEANAYSTPSDAIRFSKRMPGKRHP
ncbi:helix-turn-helix domain-containing protein [Ewingella sp. AOP9-I1-14]